VRKFCSTLTGYFNSVQSDKFKCIAIDKRSQNVLWLLKEFLLFFFAANIHIEAVENAKEDSLS
jgi:hypothetical protein